MDDDSQNKNKIVFTLLVIIIVVVIAFATVLILGERTSLLPKASSNPTVYSLENSYIFASPLSAQSGGDKIKISVFLLSDQGKGVPQKQVTLNAIPVLEVNPVQPTTDEKGQSVFEISSSTPGRFTITAQSEGNNIGPLTVNFN